MEASLFLIKVENCTHGDWADLLKWKAAVGRQRSSRQRNIFRMELSATTCRTDGHTAKGSARNSRGAVTTLTTFKGRLLKNHLYRLGFLSLYTWAYICVFFTHVLIVIFKHGVYSHFKQFIMKILKKTNSFNQLFTLISTLRIFSSGFLHSEHLSFGIIDL